MLSNHKLAKWILAVVIAACSFSCKPHDDSAIPDTVYTPVITDRETLEKSVKAEMPRSVTVPGKIYYKDKHIFIIDKMTGIHVFDNANPKTPLPVGFIKIYGCSDISIKDNYMYANNAVDLITLDLTDPEHIKVVDRIRNVLPEPAPPDGNKVPGIYDRGKRAGNLIIINWVKK